MTEPPGGLPLRAERISRRFGQVVALADISLEIGAGEALLLLGANGAGKSTFLRVVAGLLRPSSGRVLVGAGAGWTPADSRARTAVGFLGHRSLLHDHLTARENLVFYGQLYGLAADESARRADRWLDRVGLSRAAHRPVRGFSRGMLQRLTLARALIHDPRLLLLDEPASGLDGEGRTRLAGLIGEARAAGTTLLYVSHHPEAALPLVGRVVILHRGRMVEDSPAGARSAPEWIERASAVARSAA